MTVFWRESEFSRFCRELKEGIRRADDDRTTTTPIRELSLGMGKGSSSLSLSQYRGRRNHQLRRLCQAIQSNKTIADVSIGPEFDPREHLQLLEAVSSSLSNSSSLRTLYLQLGTIHLASKQEEAIFEKLSSNCKHLTTLNICDSHVTMSAPPERFTYTKDPSHLQADLFSIPTIVSRLPALKVFRWISCHSSLTMEQIRSLSYHFAKEEKELEELCVAHNPQITSMGLAILCQLPVKRLDLTSCDLQMSHASTIALVLKKLSLRDQNPCHLHLQELVLKDNFVDCYNSALIDLCRVACTRLTHLDLSEPASPIPLAHIKSILETFSDPSCTVEWLSLRGSLQTGLPVEALCTLLRSNRSIKTLFLDFPPFQKRRAYPLPEETLLSILLALEQNYFITNLFLEKHKAPRHSSIWSHINFYLRLNRAGRNILSAAGGGTSKHRRRWAQVLSNASKQPDVIFWLLNHGASELFPSNKE